MEKTPQVLNKLWKIVKEQYKIKEFLGKGCYGEVIRAEHRITKEVVAIKMIYCDLRRVTDCRNVLREIQIMQQFTKMKGNVFTTKLKDIIIDEQYNSIQTINDLPAIFLVMDYHKLDLRKMIKI